MLMPHPAVLRKLVDEYEALSATGAAEACAQERDLAYTPCVSTGTRDVDEALQTARRWLEAAAAADTAARSQATAARSQATAARSQATAARSQATAARPHTDDGPRVYA
ncbi:hypothetical protein GCM10010269_54970 [Streptomyces humidus]|uniref:DUF5133 domain-containing protein n=1 Tax=Streptomyces humidus TaxID=52259 RepID=A0A918FZR9_9ACTN|nr:DUF5133 domain-containing protein [Streptomyces humidus]GGS08932.1 hypothetical protein GCM10010269_54970 [Streptomyces humidus]